MGQVELIEGDAIYHVVRGEGRVLQVDWQFHKPITIRCLHALDSLEELKVDNDTGTSMPVLVPLPASEIAKRRAAKLDRPESVSLKDRIMGWCQTVADHDRFSNAIMGCIVLNTIILARYNMLLYIIYANYI